MFFLCVRKFLYYKVDWLNQNENKIVEPYV